MADLVGTIASCLQLLECCIKLTSSIAEVYERVKTSSERLRAHTEQIRHLIDTAILIQQTKMLQNAAVDNHLYATLTDAKKLQATLDHVAANYRKGFLRRWWQAIHGSGEKKILSSFGNLEQRKSALLLCINIVQSESLAGIECNVSRILGVVSERMTEKKTKTRWSVSATVNHIPPYRNPKSSIDGIDNKNSTAPIRCSIDVAKVSTKEEKRQSTINIAPSVYRSTMPKDQKPQEHGSNPDPASYHTFRRMKIDSGIVVNGDVYGKGKTRSVGRRQGTGNSYADIETFSGAKVINGDVFDSPGLWN